MATIQQRVSALKQAAEDTRTQQNRVSSGLVNPAAKTQPQKLTFEAPGVTMQQCSPGWHWDASVRRCVKDREPIKETVAEVVTGSPVISGTNQSMGTRPTGTSTGSTGKTFESILKGAGSQMIPGIDDNGASTEKFRFNQFEYGGKVYGFDAKGNLSEMGTAGENTNEVIGIEEGGRRFSLGKTQEAREGLQIFSREDLLKQAQGLRDSAAKYGVGLAGNANPLDGEVSGKQKIATLDKAGLYPEPSAIGTYAKRKETAFNASAPAVPSLSNLVNVDFVANSGMFDDIPGPQEGEDPKDAQIRITNAKLGKVTDFANTAKAKAETAALAKAVQEIPKVSRTIGVQTKGQIAANLKADAEFNGQFDSLKDIYRAERMNKANQEIEAEKSKMTGSTRAAQAILESIKKDIMSQAEKDIADYSMKVDQQKAASIEDISQKTYDAQKKFSALTPAEKIEAAEKEDMIKRKQAYIAQGKTPLEAEKLVAHDLSVIGKAPEKLDAYETFQDKITLGKLRKDGSNAVELMFDAAKNNLETVKTINKAWGGLTEKEFQTQLGEYKKAKFGMTDEEVAEDVKRDSVWDIMKASLNGEKITMEDMDKLDKYQFENPVAAARMKMKFMNPEMDDAEIYLAVQKKFSQPKAAKGSGTGKPGAGSVASTAMLDMMNDVYGELTAGNIGQNKTEADSYLRMMYPKSTAAQRSSAIAQIMSYDKTAGEYNLIPEEEFYAKAVGQQYAKSGATERKEAIDNAKKWMSEGEFVDGVWYPKGQSISEAPKTKGVAVKSLEDYSDAELESLSVEELQALYDANK